MLGKLMKYDFKSMLRSFVPLWIAFLAVSVINRFTVRIPETSEAVFANIVMGVSMFLYVTLMIAINVIGIVLVILRFYNGLLKDEGYLMFTLPVKPWQLVCAKGATATVLVVVNALVSAASVFILAMSKDFFDGISQMLNKAAASGINVGLLVFLVAVLMIAAALMSIYKVYASLALGHLANKHRIAWAVGAYIGISVALSIIGSVFAAVVATSGGGKWISGVMENFLANGGTVGMVWMVFLVFIVVMLVQLVAFYIITERILAKRLNLE